MVRDMDLGLPHAHDSRRLEIVADGLPLFGGLQLALDTTLVFPLHCDGSARPGAAQIDGVVLTVARRKKERTHPDLMGPHGRFRLVVLAGEARAKATSEPRILRLRWASILACSAARVFAVSLLNLKFGGG